MLIGIDASRANKNQKTGTEWYAYHLIRELAKIDNRNQYILYTDRPLRDGLVNLCSATPDSQVALPDRRGRQVLNSPHGNFRGQLLKWPWRWFWTQGRLSLAMLFNSPDVLYVPSHTLPIIHPKRSVVTIHDVGFKRQADLYSDQTDAGNRGKLLNTLARLATRGRYGASQSDYLEWSTNYILKHAAKVITISDFSKQEIADLFNADPEKLSVVHNGYNRQDYRRRSEDEVGRVLKKHGLRKPYILCVGRVEKKKNTARLIEAFAMVKVEHPDLRHRLVLIGDTAHGYGEIREIINQYELENQVILAGWVGEDDLPAIYSGAELFIFPSNYEGFGIPLLEAMACGAPMAASKAGAIPEVAGQAAIFFDPNNPADIADKIIDLILSESLRQKLVLEGGKRVSEFGWDIAARQVLEILNDLKLDKQ